MSIGQPKGMSNPVKQPPEIIAGRCCPLCDYPSPREGEGNENLMTRWVYEGYVLWECFNEGSHPPVLLSWPWESEEEYDRFYTDDARYHVLEAQQIGRDSFWQRDSEYLEANYCRLKFIQGAVRLPQSPRYLDIGTGTGALPSMARAVLGGECLGLEPNGGMVAQGQCLGRPVQKGGWQDALTRGQWDLISLSDVLEHLTRPARCLMGLRECLTETGVLYVEMPEWDGDLQNPHIKPRQHLCLYSAAAAEEMYDRCGYRVVAMQRPLVGAIRKMAHLLMRR